MYSYTDSLGVALYDLLSVFPMILQEPVNLSVDNDQIDVSMTPILFSRTKDLQFLYNNNIHVVTRSIRYRSVGVCYSFHSSKDTTKSGLTVTLAPINRPSAMAKIMVSKRSWTFGHVSFIMACLLGCAWQMFNILENFW